MEDHAEAKRVTKLQEKFPVRDSEINEWLSNHNMHRIKIRHPPNIVIEVYFILYNRYYSEGMGKGRKGKIQIERERWKPYIYTLYYQWFS